MNATLWRITRSEWNKADRIVNNFICGLEISPEWIADGARWHHVRWFRAVRSVGDGFSRDVTRGYYCPPDSDRERFQKCRSSTRSPAARGTRQRPLRTRRPPTAALPEASVANTAHYITIINFNLPNSYEALKKPFRQNCL